MLYKDVEHPRDAEPLGNLLGLSVLRALRKIECREGARIRLIRETLALPRADLSECIRALEAEQAEVLRSLQGTSLNLKTFLSLVAKHGLSPEFPSYYSHRYLHDRALGRDVYDRLDALNRGQIELYVRNIHAMERLTRIRANLDLLVMHQAQNAAAGMAPSMWRWRACASATSSWSPSPEALRGDRPGRQAAVAPPVHLRGGLHQRLHLLCSHRGAAQNRGHAQEDSDCLLADGWRALFDEKVDSI